MELKLFPGSSRQASAWEFQIISKQFQASFYLEISPDYRLFLAVYCSEISETCMQFQGVYYLGNSNYLQDMKYTVETQKIYGQSIQGSTTFGDRHLVTVHLVTIFW